MAATEPTNAQLRPALQLALDVAGSAGTRPLPGRVRSLVRARRRPANWPVVMRQSLDEDDAFRQLVAAEAVEDDLGRVPWLWLARPEGWAQDLEMLLESAAEEEERKRERLLADERISALEAELAETRDAAAEALSTRARLLAELDDRRRAAATAEGRLGRAEAALAEARAAAEEAQAAASALEARLSEAERGEERLRREIAGLLESGAEAESRAQEARRRLAAEMERHQQESEQARAEQASVAAAVGRAADAASLLGQALAEAAALLGGDRRPGEEPPRPARPEGGGAPGVLPPAPARSRPRTRPQQRPGRKPLALPPAIDEADPEAAQFLVGHPGVRLIVDGYNVAFTSWGRSELPALRHRLVGALSELALRRHVLVTVVFDGVDDGGVAAAPPAARHLVRIVFSPSAMEADDVIRRTVDTLPAGVPVVVATDDRAVRDDVRAKGANVLTVEQLLGVLGRQIRPRG